MNTPPNIFVNKTPDEAVTDRIKKEVTWLINVKRNRPIMFSMHLAGFAV